MKDSPDPVWQFPGGYLFYDSLTEGPVLLAWPERRMI